jgi:hypothetical protein
MPLPFFRRDRAFPVSTMHISYRRSAMSPDFAVLCVVSPTQPYANKSETYHIILRSLETSKSESVTISKTHFFAAPAVLP